MTSHSKFTFKKKLLSFVVLGLVAGFAYFSVFHQTETPRSVFQHFRNAERIEFCTTKPTPQIDGVPDDFGYGNIEGHSIVDRVYLKNQASVLGAIAWSDRMNNSTSAACFNPRHAIRDAENKNNYLLICFECLQMKYCLEGETGSAQISSFQKKFFEKLVDAQSMTRAADLN